MAEVWLKYGCGTPKIPKYFHQLLWQRENKVIESNEASTFVAPDSKIYSFLSTTK